MSQQNAPEETRKISKFVNDFRKKLSLLKTKSFYANHLCKRSCLEGKLNSNPEQCFTSCDNWLQGFYDLKRATNPEGAQEVLYSVESKYDAIKGNQDLQFQKNYARAKLETTMYLQKLEQQLNKKITEHGGKI